MKHHGQSGKVVAQGSSFPSTPPVNKQVQTGIKQAPTSLPKPKPNVQHNHGHGGGMKGY